MTRHRRSRSVLAVLEDDDLLWEILVRLLPQPSSLPRTSVVCKRWRRLATDPRFVQQFYKHHRKPPLLGFFEYREGVVFTPVLDPPDRIPPVRFDLVRYGGHHDDDSVLRFPSENYVLGCRHGLVLVGDHLWREVIVCDPITGKQCPVTVPLEFQREWFNRAVLCAAHDQGHVHGACHSSHFKVVLVSMYREYNSIYGLPIARVYSSETNTWSGLISISTEASRNNCYYFGPSTLVGNVLYWPSHDWGDKILEFDLDTQNLTVIKGPPGVNYFDNYQIIQAEDGVVGIAVLSYNTLRLWQRMVNYQGDAIWSSCKIVPLRNLINIPPRTGRKREYLRLVGYDDATHVIFLGTHDSVYMVQRKSMQTRKLNVIHSPYRCYPFTSFYPPGTTISRGTSEAEILHNM